MPDISGNWDIAVQTPMGEQRARLTVAAEGEKFTGRMFGALGDIAIPDGRIEGDTLRCTLDITAPLPMRVDVTATVSGDALRGTVDAGLFGSMPLSGVRA